MNQNEKNASLMPVLNNFLESSSEADSCFLFCQTRSPGALYSQVSSLARERGRAFENCGIEKIDHTAFGPFLSWIREQVSGYTPQELEAFLNKSGVYAYHKSLLRQYFSGEIVWRSEELIAKELEFEISCMYNAITGMIETLSDRGIHKVFILGNAQNMSASAVSYLLHIWKDLSGSKKLPFKVFFIVSLEHLGFEQEGNAEWHELLELAEERQCYLNLTLHEIGEVSKPLMVHCGCGIEIAIENYFLLAIEDSRVILECLYKEGEEGRRKLNEPEQFLLWKFLGSIYYLRREYDLATGAFQTALSIARKNAQGDKIADLYFRIGLVHFEKRNLDYARSMASQCWKLAQTMKNEPVMFYARFLEFLIQDKVRLQNPEDFRIFYLDITQRAKNLGFINLLAFLYTNPFGLYSEYTSEAYQFQDRGLRLAKKDNNIYRLAYAYQTAALVNSVKGEYAQTLENYEKSRRLKTRLKDPLEMCYINNGMGFYNYMIGEYTKAHKYYMHGLNFLREAKDFDEVGMTLFNMSANALLSGNYKLSVILIEKCLELLRTMNNRHLAYHSEFGLYVLLGVSLYLGGDISHAWQINLKIGMNQLQPFPNKNEEFFLKHLFQALLQENSDELENAKKYLFEPNDNIEYFAPFYYLTAGDLLTRAGKSEEARLIWQDGLVNARERNNQWYIAQLAARLDPAVPEPEPIRLRGLDNNWGWILSSAKMQKHLVNLHQRVEDIQFLNTFQIVSSGAINEKRLLTETMDLLFNSFETAAVYFVSWNRTKPVIKETRGEPREFDAECLNLLLPVLKEKRGQRFFSDLPDEILGGNQALRYISAFSIFLETEGQAVGQVLFLFDKRDGTVRTETMQVLSIAVRQLELALNRLEQNEIIQKQNEELSRKNLLLEKTATTDQLTGIGNRNSLEAAIKLELSRMIRSRRPAEMYLSILFIDLDNFKYYNDTYGHALGDRILFETANLLEKCSRDTDLVFRYGGDEFVVLLPETPLTGAKGVADRIISCLQEAGSFAAVISSLTGTQIEVPANRQLSCSIGITGCSGSDKARTDINDLLSRSDHALYQAKKEGKSRSVILQE